MLITVRDHTPQVPEDCFVAAGAIVAGEVIIGTGCSIWFNAVVRGDVCRITIGNETNIQDGAIVHGTYQKTNTVIGHRVSVGHGAVVHGCTIEDDVLIGMKAVVMDHAIIKSGCIVAAGAVVTEGTITEAGYIYAGVPARKIKQVDANRKDVFLRTSQNYQQYADWYRTGKTIDFTPDNV